MQQKYVIGATIAILALSGAYYYSQPKNTTNPEFEAENTNNPETQIRSIAEEFGTRIKEIDLSASEEAIITDIKTHYGPLISDLLLEGWEMNPSFAPGKLTPEGPSPDSLEITSIDATDDGAYEVQGLVIESTKDNPGANSYQVALKFRSQNGRWVITGFTKAL